MKNILIAGLTLAISVSLSTAAGEGWMTDFEAARKKAVKENKALLVDFTGSDWCGWCIKLADEVFKHEAFKLGVADKFVLVELDYPRDPSKISEEIQKQNAELKEKYSVRGFPTILLLDPDGRPFAQTGYQPGGPEKYVAHLDVFLAMKEKRDAAITEAEKLQGTAKAKALVAAISLIPDELLAHYSEITEQISQLDPEDTTGFLAKQKRSNAKKSLETEVMNAMRSGQTDEILTKIDQFISDYEVSGEERQELLGMKMNPLLGAGNFDEAGKVIDEIIAAAPESEGAKFAANFKPRLQKMKQDAAKPSKNPAHGQPGHICDEHEKPLQ